MAAKKRTTKVQIELLARMVKEGFDDVTLNMANK